MAISNALVDSMVMGNIILSNRSSVANLVSISGWLDWATGDSLSPVQLYVFLVRLNRFSRLQRVTD
jgi:hypothetical protein